MIIAIPLFGDRVSHDFETSPVLLKATVGEEGLSSMVRFRMVSTSPSEMRNKIRLLGIDTIICGGIDRKSLRWFERRGIRVIPDVSGEAEDILANLSIHLRATAAGSRRKELHAKGGQHMNFEEIKSAILGLDDGDKKRLILEVVPAIWASVSRDDATLARLTSLVDEAATREYREQHFDSI